MKKRYILLMVLFVVASSCQKSQFSTTTRQYRNGRVTYVNNYHKERSKTSKGTSDKSHLKNTDVQSFTEPEITKDNTFLMHNYENLIASTSNQTTIPAVNENRFISNNDLILSDNDKFKIASTYSHPDTVSTKKSKKGKTYVPPGKQVIFFKSGQKEPIKIISQSHDTLFYTSSKNPGLVVGVMMEQIDTILWIPFGEQVIKYKSGKEESVNIISQSHDTIFYTLIKKPNIIQAFKMEQIDTIVKVKYYDSVKGKVVDIRKNEPHSVIGFILSILGLVPLFGLPFAILALTIGYHGLKKIHSYPLRYKGKELATASMVIGIIGLIVFFIAFIIFASNLKCSSGGMRV